MKVLRVLTIVFAVSILSSCGADEVVEPANLDKKPNYKYTTHDDDEGEMNDI